MGFKSHSDDTSLFSTEGLLAQCHYILLAFAFLLCSPLFLLAQESDPDLIVVAETAWGFDGRVTPHEFVPLSVQVKNLGPTPWQGFLRLNRVVRGNRQFGATLQEEIYLQGDETRWFQLCPYVIDDLEDWELRWGDGQNHVVPLPPVLKGEPATVLIYDRDAVSQSKSVFKRMPDDRFPTAVTATHSLRGVVLESVPFWQGARARAFYDWLYLGGRVYLLHNESGTFPSFPVALDFLNSDQDEFKVGMGIVKKIPRQAADYSLDEARVEIFNDEKVKQTTPLPAELEEAQYDTYSSYGMSQRIWSKHYDLFKELTDISAFKRRWWLIYLAVFSYLAVLYPGCFTVGTEHKKVGQFYVLFFAAAAFFALVFGLLGQVGGQSRNRIRTVMVARSLGEGNFETTGWSVLANIFAGEQAVAYPGRGQVYSTTQEAEYVRGTMNPGIGGEVRFDMLPDSKRTVHFRSLIKTGLPTPQPQLQNLGEEQTRSISFNIANCFPSDPLHAVAVFQGRVYELEAKGNLLELKQPQSPELLVSYLKRPFNMDFGFNMWGGTVPMEDEKQEELKKLVGMKQYIRMMRALIGNSFGLIDEIDASKLQLDNTTLRLFVLTEMPATFRVETGDFPDQEGAVLFTYDVKY